MTQKALTTNLVGKYIVPEPTVFKDKALFERIWNLQSTASGHFFGEIMAAWKEADANTPKLTVRGPNGDINHIYLHAGLFRIFNSLEDAKTAGVFEP